MTEALIIGVIQGGAPTPLGLAQAAARHPGLSVRTLAVDAPVSSDVTGLILDVPLHERAALLQEVVPHWRVPILVESPFAGDLESARTVAPIDGIVAANPLRYAIHTRRLLEEIVAAQDPLETFFAAWRFRAAAETSYALPQLLDFLSALAPGEPSRVSAMHHAGPDVLTVTLRYASDVLGSIELGSHLPASFPSASELIVECFCRASAYACLPDKQAVQLYGQNHAEFNWQPDPADAIVAAFAAWLGGGPRPIGGVANDVTALRLADRIGQALLTGGVLEAQTV